MKLIKLKHTVWLMLIGFSLNGISQTAGDSLTYKNIVDVIIKNNPIIKQAEEKVNNAQFKEQLVKSAYFPNVYASANVSKLYPIPSIDFPMPDPQTGQLVKETFQMYPDYNMDYGIKVNQLLYDFGKTQNTLGVQQAATDISKLSVEQIKQQLALSAAGLFYNLVYIQSAISIKEDELKTLNQHLEFVKSKLKTGSAIQYEMLTTQVHITNTETQLKDLKTTQQIQLSHLSNLMDTSNITFAVKEEISNAKPFAAVDTFFDYAMKHRDDMLLAEKKEKIAELNYKMTLSSNNPSLSFFGGTGFKNGYLSDINKLEFNYVAGLALNIPIFDGNRKNINKQIANSGISDVKFEIEKWHNSISDDVKESYVSLQLAEEKIAQFKTQLQQAQEAYSHAQINYKAGTLTNLDVLDAENALAESKLMLLKASIDYNLYLLKFKASIGDRLY